MNSDEYDLLEWLSHEDVSQYGECYGKSLDSLIAKGLAIIHGPESGINNPFIAKGHGIMFRAVSLTVAGKALLMRSKK